MVATNAVRPRSGNVSAGTSVFAMIVLEKSLSRVHAEIDIVATPDGKPVAMAHANNGSSDLDAWIALFGQVAEALGAERAAGRALREAPAARAATGIRTRAGCSPSTTSPASTSPASPKDGRCSRATRTAGSRSQNFMRAHVLRVALRACGPA